MTKEQFDAMIKTRSRKHTSEVFQYFWASFGLQILVYALLGHVVIRYWGEPGMIASVLGILFYIPFTVVFIKKYKSMAVAPGPIHAVVSRRIELLQSFFTFKKRYELFLIPIATFIGTFVSFELWVPGGVWAFPKGAVITFLIALASCIVAIREENKKSFDIPLSKLRLILQDLNAN
jgi:hypothetical protein